MKRLGIGLFVLAVCGFVRADEKEAEAYAKGLYDTAAVALQDLGHPEPAAVLFGAGRHFAQGVLPDEIEELRAARERELLAELGQSQFDSLTAQGGGYTQADATAYLIEAARNATSAVE